MNFSKLSNISSLKVPRTPQQTLRPGQILQGEVLKLYPENKAEIRLGGTRMIAQLQVGLELGAKYHFQVAQTGSILELKVLGDQLESVEKLDLTRLLKQLGIKDNRNNVQLIQLLTKDSIPFDKNQLQQAVQLLKREKDKGTAANILTRMIARRLPVTENVFNSLKAAEMTTITERLKSVIQQPITVEHSKGNQAQNIMYQRLVDSISMLIDKPMTFRDGFVREVSSQIATNNQYLFNVLQGTGVISTDVKFTSWGKEWNAFLKGTPSSPVNQGQTGSAAPLPFQIKEQEVFQLLDNIKTNKGQFIQAIQRLLNDWGPARSIQELFNSPTSKEMITALHADMKKALQPFLTQGQEKVMDNQPVTQENVMTRYRGLQLLANSEHLAQLLKLVAGKAENENFPLLSPKEKFLNHMQQTNALLGLDYENRIAMQKEPSDVTQSIKGMLLQLGMNQEVGNTEQQTRLLQHIQGLQLQSVNETSTIIQANLQIPAERLGLVKDLRMEFEGKKNENGEINPDYCRILFYLELGFIGETVIDVNIQQRALSLTVFNNTDGLPIVSKSFKESLSNNLDSLGYHLANLKFKKLEGKEKMTERREENRLENTQGVDFRI